MFFHIFLALLSMSIVSEVSLVLYKMKTFAVYPLLKMKFPITAAYPHPHPNLHIVLFVFNSESFFFFMIEEIAQVGKYLLHKHEDLAPSSEVLSKCQA